MKCVFEVVRSVVSWSFGVVRSAAHGKGEPRMTRIDTDGNREPGTSTMWKRPPSRKSPAQRHISVSPNELAKTSGTTTAPVPDHLAQNPEFNTEDAEGAEQHPQNEPANHAN